MNDLNEELVMSEAAAIADNIIEEDIKTIPDLKRRIYEETEKVREILSTDEELLERFTRRIRIRVLRGVVRKYFD